MSENTIEEQMRELTLTAFDSNTRSCKNKDRKIRNESFDATINTIITDDKQQQKPQKTSNTLNGEESEDTFFWRAHTFSFLVIISIVLLYITLVDVPSYDSSFNHRCGIVAVILVFLFISTIHMPDGPFLRPHPVLWRFVMSCSIVYLLFFIYLLFQNRDDVRQLMVIFDSNLGRPLPERHYAEDCRLYAPENHENPFINVKDKFDVFVPCHFFGWWIKALILRDVWILTVLSGLFEMMEYCLEHQLPNFGECWWDHWLLDFLFCNGIGIILGMMTLKYLSMKTYEWRSLYRIPTLKGKLKRAVGQFLPYDWTNFHWGYMDSFLRWIIIWGIIMFWNVFELNTFYLKAILWVPPNHVINFYRVTLFAFIGAVTIREIYDYLDKQEIKRLGRQAWLTIFIIVVEVLFEIKFGDDIYSIPWPKWVIALFATSCFAWSIYTILYFFGPTGRKRTSSKHK